MQPTPQKIPQQSWQLSDGYRKRIRVSRGKIWNNTTGYIENKLQSSSDRWCCSHSRQKKRRVGKQVVNCTAGGGSTTCWSSMWRVASVNGRRIVTASRVTENLCLKNRRDWYWINNDGVIFRYKSSANKLFLRCMSKRLTEGMTVLY
jgi:hypothetical protein